VTHSKNTRILVTGSNGFVGRNLVSVLNRQENITVVPITRSNAHSTLESGLESADLIFHLAGVNRPETENEFNKGNADFTTEVCNRLLELGRSVPIVFTSSIQAALDNPYGKSKRQAEESIQWYAHESGAPAAIYRLRNIFGKWCRPNYNSVVATFCHNIARDLPITVSDSDRELSLIYIDDVIDSFLQHLRSDFPAGIQYPEIQPVYGTTLGQLAEIISSFRQMRKSLFVPDFADDFKRRLYGTFLTYLEKTDFGYSLDQKCDPRGCLAEFVKSAPFGQVFVSRTHPGITRGNHYHHTKAEKFLVLEGQATIRFRSILDGEVIEYHVDGRDFRVIDIPPGYTHSIENVGTTEMVTLFWASEIFSPAQADTNGLAVLN
jgi:UDP-2-acetamido-2,6-beta-L-arabino-hexul-4-ose reductase